MENLEDQNLMPENENTPVSQPDITPSETTVDTPEAELSHLEETPAFTEAESTPSAVLDAEPALSEYEWDCGMEFPPPKSKHERASRPRGGFFKRFLACALVIALVAGGCLTTGICLYSYWDTQNQQLQQQIVIMENKINTLQSQIKNNNSPGNSSSVPDAGNSLTPGQVYKQNVDAVVAISATIANGFGQASSASGSGFILTENGYVITNYHVIENASRVEVTTSSSQSYPATIVGFDAAHDVAVLKIEGTELPHVTLGSSDALIIGDQITVIGNPLGELSYTQTVGYISGKDRGISTDNVLINMLQTDAAINAGNSGGPMFNMKGEVVGIITAKYSGTSSSGASIEGIGFAIPIDDVMKKIQDLIDYGYITGAYLGVTVRDMDSSVSESFGLPMGAYVATVEPGNCAYAAGVREKDIIVGLGEHTVGSINDLTSALQEFKAGDVTTISVWRSGTVHEFTITLDEKPH